MKNLISGEQLNNEVSFNSVETESINEINNLKLIIDDCSEVKNKKQENIAKEDSSLNLKKFKTVQDLEQAYENLEAEFTKKSQKLKELEKAQDIGMKNEDDKSESVSSENKPNNAQNINPTSDELLEFIRNNESVKSSFLKGYIESLTKNAPPVVISGKGGSFMPSKEKTILDFNEADEAVRKIFE